MPISYPYRRLFSIHSINFLFIVHVHLFEIVNGMKEGYVDAIFISGKEIKVSIMKVNNEGKHTLFLYLILIIEWSWPLQQWFLEIPPVKLLVLEAIFTKNYFGCPRDWISGITNVM